MNPSSNVNASRVSGSFSAQEIKNPEGGKLDGMTVTQDREHRGSVKDKIADAFRSIGTFFKSLGSRIAKAFTPPPRQPKEPKPPQTFAQLDKTLGSTFPFWESGSDEVKSKKSVSGESKVSQRSEAKSSKPSNMTEMMESKALSDFTGYAEKALIGDGLRFFSLSHQATTPTSVAELKDSIQQMRQEFTGPERKEDLVLHTRDGECKRLTNELDSALASIEQKCSEGADLHELQGEVKKALSFPMDEYSSMLQEHLLRFNSERK